MLDEQKAYNYSYYIKKSMNSMLNKITSQNTKNVKLKNFKLNKKLLMSKKLVLNEIAT